MLETDVTGNKRSIIGETIYDKRFKSSYFSSGLQPLPDVCQERVCRLLTRRFEMNQAKTAAFAEVQGNIKKVSYGVSAGLTRSYFKGRREEHTYYTLLPHCPSELLSAQERQHQLSVQCRTQDSFAQCIDQCGAGDRYHPDSTR